MLDYNEINIDVYCGDIDEPLCEQEFRNMTFPVFKLDDDIYDYLIVAPSVFASPTDVYKIADKLGIKQARILYDSFIRTHNSFNRYMFCDYNNDKPHIGKWHIVLNVG